MKTRTRTLALSAVALLVATLAATPAGVTAGMLRPAGTR